MLGLNDLGIGLNWKFRFLGHGSQVVSLPGTICVDLGGTIEDGIYDHHNDDNQYLSSTSVITENSGDILKHLLGPINNTRLSGRKIETDELTLCFVTHIAPDWDGIASFFLVDYLVKHGELPHPNIVNGLREATDRIDQGKAVVAKQVNRPFLVYLMLMNETKDWGTLLSRGRDLIADVIDTHSPWEVSADSFLDPWNAPEQWTLMTELLRQDYGLYMQDCKTLSEYTVYLPRKNDSAKKSPLYVFEQPPRCRLHKYWVREELPEGVLVIPFYSRSDTSRTDRFVISVDASGKYTLPLLGYELEKLETEKRIEKNLPPRIGEPRFEPEYCNNGDPWYDGRGHGFTIIDSPRCGTVLDSADVVSTIQKLYAEPVYHTFEKSRKELDAFISYRRKGGSGLAWTLYTYLQEKHDRKIFLDVDSLKNGKFDDQLRDQLHKCRNFILLLSPQALERCADEEDWVRQEIETALSLKKNIIPVMMDGFDYGSFETAPGSIAAVSKINAVLLKHEYFQEGLEKVARFMV